MKIFLTGGTGFIGSHVAILLAKKGHEISILARNPNKVPKLHTIPNITIIDGTLSAYDIIEENLENKDACIHIALGGGNKALEWLKQDTTTSIFLFTKAAELGIKKFIYTSSTAAIGDYSKRMTSMSYPTPTDYYGATKAASESYFIATSYNSQMKCNIIRPGYTFGNPVIEGSSMQSDKRFFDIIQNAKNGKDIKLVKNDGTQFIHAGDLAKLYDCLLDSDKNRSIYFGLGINFYTWEKIAKEAIKLANSKSNLILEDLGYGDTPIGIDVSDMKRDFNLEFESWENIVEHIKYLMKVL